MGCSVDLFLFNNAYIDVATLSQVNYLFLTAAGLSQSEKHENMLPLFTFIIFYIVLQFNKKFRAIKGTEI